MKIRGMKTGAVALLLAGLLALPALAEERAGEVILLAQGGSCQSWFNTCANRCKTRNPTDKACVSDHCSPKLADCRRSGCWQEGGLYGGGRHCGLAK